ncbi:MAG TPA: glycosyltransferase family 4 protein [Candidatus Methylomirabilis sp.]|nr:glycosyltransferase family 4 protein [Candidatus Methylomirabilis sp.]
MKPPVALRALITNNTLAERSGSVLYVRDLTRGLLARGIVPALYTSMRGEIADEFERAGVEVVDDLRRLSMRPDVIHGHHEIPAMSAFLHFPGVPGIFVCHDRHHHSDIPPKFPRIRRYVSVDYFSRERLVEHGIPEERIRVVPNGVDLERFAARGPLPGRPRRALIFSNNASERTYVPAVREACARAGVSVDVIGLAAGRVCTTPEAVLGQYDIVLAKGRCALEAAAVGTAVILCDAVGAGPLVTAANLDTVRYIDGQGIRHWLRPLRPDIIAKEIAGYDAEDAAEVSRRVREWVDLRTTVAQLVAIYQEALAEQASAVTTEGDEAAAAAAYWLTSRNRRLRDRLKHLPGIGRVMLAMKQKIAPYRPVF